jgi:hypothetical protein
MITLRLTEKEFEALQAAVDLAFEDNDEELTGISDDVIDSLYDKILK